MKTRVLLRRVSPILLSLGALLLLLAVQLGLDWSIDRLNPGLPIWSLKHEVLRGLGLFSLVGGLLYVILLQASQREKDIAKLNHEIRNALQIVLYVVSSDNGPQKKAACEAIERVERTIREVST